MAKLENIYPLSHFKVVIFDCDGVLLDSEDIAGKVEIEALKGLGISAELDAYNRRFAGVTTVTALQTIANENGIYITDDWIKEVEQKIVEALVQEVKVIPYVQQTLQSIKLPKAVASNSHYDHLFRLLHTRNLDHYFEGHIFSADMVERPKPYPDLYRYVAKHMGVSPSECLVIEDSPTGTQSAHEAGMKVLGFIGTHQGREVGDSRLFKAGADVVFNDMSQLPKLIEVENYGS